MILGIEVVFWIFLAFCAFVSLAPKLVLPKEAEREKFVCPQRQLAAEKLETLERYLAEQRET